MPNLSISPRMSRIYSAYVHPGRTFSHPGRTIRPPKVGSGSGSGSGIHTRNRPYKSHAGRGQKVSRQSPNVLNHAKMLAQNYVDPPVFCRAGAPHQTPSLLCASNPFVYIAPNSPVNSMPVFTTDASPSIAPWTGWTPYLCLPPSRRPQSFYDSRWIPY